MKSTCYLIYSLPQIYEEFYHTISNADAQKDLKWWSNNHGINMPMAWPEFVVNCVMVTLFLAINFLLIFFVFIIYGFYLTIVHCFALYVFICHVFYY